jgi:hypothetical protein
LEENECRVYFALYGDNFDPECATGSGLVFCSYRQFARQKTRPAPCHSKPGQLDRLRVLGNILLESEITSGEAEGFLEALCDEENTEKFTTKTLPKIKKTNKVCQQDAAKLRLCWRRYVPRRDTMLAEITSILGIARAAIDIGKEAKELLPEGQDKSNIETRLVKTEKELAIAEAETAKELGYDICKCTFPPQIMLFNKDSGASQCPNCNHKISKGSYVSYGK